MATVSGVSSSFPVDSSAASTTNFQLSEQTQKIVNAGGMVLSAAAAVGLSALAAGLFTTISPLGGAVFGIGSLVGHGSVTWLCDKVGCLKDTLVGKTVNSVLPIIASLGLGCAALSAAGFAWTPGAAVAISLGGYVISSAAVGVVFIGALSLMGYLGYNLAVQPNSTSAASTSGSSTRV